ncbi:NUDIX domain-containing protein [Litoreibacter roseus]|uniref:NUDIX hydrolase n=1 Tax=Litoreibacter roseus TaxID=2601869 RepID=A0A6N6JBH3_9RHOB|nr:NUDIX hydrolase [Litoreibacter roseus]GFE63347.1 NUDIX hydrolase [Litoreibacter roseus]
MSNSPRLAVRAVILHENRLLLVNAFGSGLSDLWCAPGGGVELGSSLPDNLMREVHEETGLRVNVGAPCLVNEFEDSSRDFHQIDVYFRCEIVAGTIDQTWKDPEGIVTQRRFFSRNEMSAIRFKPDSLSGVAFADAQAITYDPLEPIVF